MTCGQIILCMTGMSVNDRSFQGICGHFGHRSHKQAVSIVSLLREGQDRKEGLKNVQTGY